ncbi:MAG TPA: glycosyltransferase family 39 protein [Bryobacteraceae bacterium]
MPDRESLLIGKPNLSSWQRLADGIEAKSSVFAIALAICFVLSSLIIATRRPLWFDEIMTVVIARASTIGDLLATFRLTVDQTPPLNALLVRFFSSLLGWTELAARLPSTIVATAGLLILFHRVKKLTNGLFGLAAMSVLLVTFLPNYAYEARPYALFFLASVLSISLWTSIPDGSYGRSARVRPVLFGLAVMLGALAHYYAVLLILPFCAEEARNRGLRRLVSVRLFCGIAGLGLGLAVQFPFILGASRQRILPFLGTPSSRALLGAYTEILNQLVFALVCVVLVLTWLRSQTTVSVEKQSAEERVGWFFLGIPIAGYVLAETVTRAFWPRYFIPMLAGLTLAFGCFLYRRYRNSPQVPMLIVLVTVVVFIGSAFNHIRNARTPVVSWRTEEADFVDEMLPRFAKDRRLFVVLPFGRSYLEARYYATNPQMLRMLAPSNRPLWYRAENPLGIRYFSRDDLRQHGREAVLISPSPSVLSDLENFGFRVHWLMTQPVAVIYPE